MTTIKEYLQSVLLTGNSIQSLDYIKLGIIEESGEVAGKVKRFRRGDSSKEWFKDGMKKELGDLTWYLILYTYKSGQHLAEFRSPKNTRIMDNIYKIEVLKANLISAKNKRHEYLATRSLINTVTDLAWNFGFTMEDIIQANMQKTKDRFLRNKIRGQGDER